MDPLLEGSYSDDSGGHRGVGGVGGRSVGSRQELDGATDTHSVARSYNETIVRPATRPLHTPTGASYRSSRSRATSDDGRTMAERDGGSSFVLNPASNQLYRIHVG